MEKPTSFNLSEAIGRWRAEFGSPSPVNAVELDELETHLRDHAAALEGGGMTPEIAFHAAVRQLGDRRRVASEFAKINPHRVWLERAIWMVLGIFLISIFDHLARVPNSIIISHSFAMRWNPAVCIALAEFGSLASVVVMAALLWFGFSRRPNWGRALVYSCERSLLATGVAMVIILWGCDRFSYFPAYVLDRWLPQLYAWLFPMDGPANPDAAALNKICLYIGIVEDMIWAAVLCVLAARVVRQQSRLLAAGGERKATDSPWLERFMWMIAGSVLVQVGSRDLYCFVLLPVFWILPVLGQSAVLQHLVGLTTAALRVAAWTTPFWALWIFTTLRPQLGAWIRQAFQRRPFWTSVGVTLLLNVNVVLWLLFLWTDIHAKTPGNGLGPIISEWNFGSWTGICQCFVPAVLLVALLRQRMKLREA